MDVNVLLIVLISLALTAVFAWKIGARSSAMALDAARIEGRAEASIEVARLQERITFLDANSQQNLERATTLEATLQRAEERFRSAETQCVQLEERLVPMAGLQNSLQTAEAAVASTAADLNSQREFSSRLAAQLESATTAAHQMQERITQLSDLEQALRAKLAERDGEISTQRETVGRLGAQLESVGIRVQQADRQIADLVTVETTLRAQLRDRDAILLELREISGGLRAELEGKTAMLSDLQEAQARWLVECAELQSLIGKANVANAELQSTLAGERKNADEKLNVLLSSRDDLVNQFKSLASEILEEKSKRFSEQNANALGQILQPVREQLQVFHAKVDEVYRTEGQERAALGEQLKNLLQLNQSLSVDAQNLTRALKGDQKTQGTWGEIVLDTVLEQAGLIEGTHYDRQMAYQGEDQKRAIPDIVIRLPGDRQLVVDSKVSLTAYERGVAATTAEERELHIKQHLTSLRNHIRSLSERNYQQLYQLKSLDFVLLFVPLEPAFATAVSNDNLIFRDAWDRNVILVSPSTLLFVVRTVAYLWRQENQTRNVLEIAKRGAALYDKLCGFVEDLADVGKRIQQTVKAYDGAMKRLAVGDGNVIRQAEMLRDLGIKPSKQLPMPLVDKALSTAQQSLITESVDSVGVGRLASVEASLNSAPSEPDTRDKQLVE